MDRRQQKTRYAIFEAFTTLISKKQYNKITIQEIIDEANVGRSTFYAHFETKEELLQTFCQELFDHVMESAENVQKIKGRYSDEEAPESVFCHLLHHLQNNDHNVLVLLASDNGNVFLNYFKNCLKDLIREQMVNEKLIQELGLPVDYVVNHIAGTFVETVQWWCQNGRRETPEELDRYYQAMLPDMIRD